MNETVSLIVPCYNKEKTIARFLDSLLNQTYKNIQLIIVDDGSTDHSRDAIDQYSERLIKAGIQVDYVYQENTGLGAAINTGLKHVKGKYLCWADPDDFYMPESFEKRVNILESHPEYAVVSSDAYVYQENDLEHPLKREATRFEHRFEEDQFWYLLTEQSHFCAGCHMVRMSAFDQVNPSRNIYPARRGQNWQLLLPLYYAYKRFYLDEPLYAYVVSSSNMSQGDNTEKKELTRWNEHEDIIRHTLITIPLTNEEKQKADRILKTRYAKKKLYTAIDYRDKKLLSEQYDILVKLGENSKEIKESYLRNKYFVCKLYYKGKEILKKKYV